MSDLASVRDIDCLASFSPLAFDLGSSYVTGADAILRRVLYRWCSLLATVRHAPDLGLLTPLLDLDGATFAPGDLAGLRAQLEKQAKDEAFVGAASVPVTLSETGALSVKGAIQLTDGKTYPLELSASAVRAELLKLGSNTA